ncbi:MerR family transcriptional regulator [Pseudomonas sp.]|uniref:MerR family transcriptional regulator n=1 Tax=Pseudomonas sp. TaxID=306 RepID=UPI00299E83B8|nr:MerR family transcriptional regulator [Pseudomonas sp.]MDX1366430.1 MerR family transcriptional regulator [Pseudomonas sp.]
MYIGQLAKLTACTPKAIRHYEKIGLLPAPLRQGSYRRYDQHHVTLVRMIRQAQAVGFKLTEILPLITEKLRSQRFPLEVANLGIEQKRVQLQAEIQALQRLDQQLLQLKQDINHLFAPH